MPQFSLQQVRVLAKRKNLKTLELDDLVLDVDNEQLKRRANGLQFLDRVTILGGRERATVVGIDCNSKKLYLLRDKDSVLDAYDLDEIAETLSFFFRLLISPLSKDDNFLNPLLESVFYEDLTANTNLKKSVLAFLNDRQIINADWVSSNAALKKAEESFFECIQKKTVVDEEALNSLLNPYTKLAQNQNNRNEKIVQALAKVRLKQLGNLSRKESIDAVMETPEFDALLVVFIESTDQPELLETAIRSECIHPIPGLLDAVGKGYERHHEKLSDESLAELATLFLLEDTPNALYKAKNIYLFLNTKKNSSEIHNRTLNELKGIKSFDKALTIFCSKDEYRLRLSKAALWFAHGLQQNETVTDETANALENFILIVQAAQAKGVTLSQQVEQAMIIIELFCLAFKLNKNILPISLMIRLSEKEEGMSNAQRRSFLSLKNIFNDEYFQYLDRAIKKFIIDTSAPPIEIFEADHLLPKLKAIFEEKQTIEALKARLKQFLAERWRYIRGCTSLSYVLNNKASINWLCRQIAIFIDPVHANLLLMPTLAMETDIEGTNINDLCTGQFILTEDGKSFIALKGLFERAAIRTRNAQTPLYTYFNNKQQEEELTAFEKEQVFALIPHAESFDASAHALIHSEAQTAFGVFQMLRNGLKNGSKKGLRIGATEEERTDREYNAGYDADVAVLEFYTRFKQLNTEQRATLRGLSAKFLNGDTFYFGKDILDYLCKSEEAAKQHGLPSVSYCVEILGDNIDTILKVPANEALLKTIPMGRGTFGEQQQPQQQLQQPETVFAASKESIDRAIDNPGGIRILTPAANDIGIVEILDGALAKKMETDSVLLMLEKQRAGIIEKLRTLEQEINESRSTLEKLRVEKQKMHDALLVLETDKKTIINDMYLLIGKIYAIECLFQEEQELSNRKKTLEARLDVLCSQKPEQETTLKALALEKEKLTSQLSPLKAQEKALDSKISQSNLIMGASFLALLLLALVAVFIIGLLLLSGLAPVFAFSIFAVELIMCGVAYVGGRHGLHAAKRDTLTCQPIKAEISQISQTLQVTQQNIQHENNTLQLIATSFDSTRSLLDNVMGSINSITAHVERENLQQKLEDSRIQLQEKQNELATLSQEIADLKNLQEDLVKRENKDKALQGEYSTLQGDLDQKCQDILARKFQCLNPLRPIPKETSTQKFLEGITSQYRRRGVGTFFSQCTTQNVHNSTEDKKEKAAEVLVTNSNNQTRSIISCVM